MIIMIIILIIITIINKLQNNTCTPDSQDDVQLFKLQKQEFTKRR